MDLPQGIDWIPRRIISGQPDYMEYLVSSQRTLLNLVTEIDTSDRPFFTQLLRGADGKLTPTRHSTTPFTVYRRKDLGGVRSHWVRVWTNEAHSEESWTI